MNDPDSFDAEKRTNPRQQYVNFAWFKRIDEGASEEDEGVARSCDISKEGAGLVAIRGLPSGARVFLQLIIRQGRVSMICRVMHCRQLENGQYRIGLLIEVLPPADRPIWETMRRG